MKRQWILILPASALFALLTVFSSCARAGAESGLSLWGRLLVPSLLPFFVSAGLLMRLGLPEALGRLLSPTLGKWLRVSGAGCSLFVLGLSGGYPLGAASASEMVKTGRLTKEEAERLLRFCDNSGPAFAVGAMGAGVFGSALWGLLLWGVHALCALLLGLLLRPEAAPERLGAEAAPGMSPGAALSASVPAAVNALLSIGGYVVFFSGLLALGGEFGFPERAALMLASLLGGDASVYRALLCGSLELSSGIGAMAGLPLTPGNLALASFLLGWGGLCVHAQSAAVAQDTGLDMRGRLWGKLLHGVLSAGVMYGAAAIALHCSIL